ncbi:hypothetical protein BHE74_00026100 [Ensete ventricosum]|nr:hypothetical protein GW17_00052867 [Ensete ventricosum]RWW66524.1 hypothetical protein BHE74_00026100 [Ensete ventricosum]
MHPPRFPKSGIRAKATRRGGQPPCKAGHCKGTAGCSQGQPAREVGAAHRGSSPQGRPVTLAGVVALRSDAYGHNWLRPAHKGGSRSRAHPLTAQRLQRGPAERRPQGAAAPTVGVATPWQGGCRLARAVVACAGAAATVAAAAQMGQEGLGHSFEKRTILPL